MRDVVVLCYHAVSEHWPAPLSVRPQRLQEQLEFMLARGYVGTTFTEAVSAPTASKALVVTFDDCFRSMLELGLPILDRLGIPATVFAVADFADEGRPLRWDGVDHWQAGPHSSELASLSWRELGELAAHGWEVGSHTCSHPRLTTLSDGALATELQESRERCAEAIGRACASIAYPYGDVDARVVDAAATAGYHAGAALPPRLHRERRLEWPRIGVYRKDDVRRFELKVSRAVRLARRLARR